MTATPPGTLRVLRLLAVNSLRRMLRAMQIARAVRQQKTAQQKNSTRRGTPRKKGSKALTVLMVCMLPILAFQALIMSARAVQGLAGAASTEAEVLMVQRGTYRVLRWAERDLERIATSGDEDTRATRRDERLTRLRDDLGNVGREATALDRVLPHFERHGLAGFRHVDALNLIVDAADWPKGEGADRALDGTALLLAALFLSLLAAGLGAGNADLGRAEWSFTWLLTFPVATRSIVLAKILEYALVQFFTWFTVFPLLLQVYLGVGLGGMAPVLAALATLGFALTIGALRLWLETWLRLRLPLQHVRSVQGACTLIGITLLFAIFAATLQEQIPSWFLALVTAAPPWLPWLPTNLPLAAIDSPFLAGGLWLAFVGGVLMLSLRSVSGLLQHGVVRTGGTTSGGRGQEKWQRPSTLRGVLGKDLRLVLRDRNFMVQTLVVPLVFIGLQLAANRGLGSAVDSAATGWHAVMAYVVGAYALTAGCFQVLSGEGRALWMLYALPVELADVLQRKIRLWATTASALALGALVLLTMRAGLHPGVVVDAGLVVAGVWMAAYLAASIAALGTDPAADHVPRQVKARHTYLYLFLAGTYVAGLQSEEWSRRIAVVVLFGTLAYAIWQRVRERLPYLLDPVTRPAPTLSLFDAGTAAMTYFVLQTVGLVIVAAAENADSIASLSLPPVIGAFVGAGAVTTLVFGVVLKLRGLPVGATLGFRLPPRGVLRSLAVGALVGAGAGALGLGYVWLLRRQEWFALPDAPDLAMLDHTTLLALAVVAAPLCEEILFRGLVFGALARTVPVALAVVWSAGLFAVCHPVVSWLPVFGLGVGTALVYRHTAWLPAAMVAHAVYNWMVVGA